MKTPSAGIVLSLLFSAISLFPLGSEAQAPSGSAQGSNSSADQRFWIQGDYLLWWMRGNQLPPLATSGLPGAIGAPGTTVLFGGKSVDSQGRNGGRVSLGYWLDDEHRFGLDASLILIGFNGGTRFSAAANGTPLTRPFFNVLTGANDSMLVSAPGIDSGEVAAATADNLQSVSFALRRSLGRGLGHHFQLIGGYRYFRYQDTLTIEQSSAVLIPFIAGTAIAGTDRFAANNNFHGAEVGLEKEMGRGPFSLNLVGRVAVGAEIMTANINGTTTVASPMLAGSTTFEGDLLALSSNIGSRSNTSFAVLPQVGATGRYSFGKFSLSVGYIFLYLNDLLRTAGEIDESVNPSLIPPAMTSAGPANPQPRMERSAFWAQGINAGLQYRF